MKPSPAFQQWFGDSKVVDDAGQPMVVYHGTSAQFDVFDAGRQGQTAGVGGGFFFTSSREVANDVYGWREGGHVMEAYLSLKNILGFKQYFDLTGKDEDEETSGARDAPVNYFDNHAEEIVAFAKEHGYDGIWWPADPDSQLAHDLIVAFDPEQITSATKNFDERSITKSADLITLADAALATSSTGEDVETAGSPQIRSHSRWSVYEEKSAQVGDGMIRWVESSNTVSIIDIQAGQKTRGRAMVQWLKDATGKELGAVGVVKEAEQFWDKMEAEELITGWNDENFVDYFGLGSIRFSLTDTVSTGRGME